MVQIGTERPPRLCQLLASPSVRKVFHHAPFDLRFMVAQWSVVPSNVACTKVASKLLFPDQPGPQHSLLMLLEDHLGVTISKAQRLTDWLAADLTPAQLAYACGDVEHLLDLLDLLQDKLQNVGLREDFDACLRFLPTRVKLELGRWPDVFGY